VVGRPDDLNEPVRLSMPESLRILDVALELRQQQDTALAELNQDEMRSRLRKKLLETAELTGESVSADEIDVAIEHYFDTLHSYQDPPMNFNVWLAHLYIRRVRVAAVLLAIVGLVLLIYWWSR
jgi:hypothetical protein